MAALQDQRVLNEMSVRSPFESLLQETARLKDWTFIAELSGKSGGALIRPDGTLRDRNSLPRGYWEAKDTQDDLDTEIKKKIARGYPLSNIIFEDTQTGVLFQNKQKINGPYILGNPKELVALLNQFFSYTEPDIEGFEEAVDEFKERVPDLARGLVEKIQQAHKDNAPFQAAFEKFFELCRTALNPNIRVEAVDEMLVQHLLTERLFRTVFNNPEFVKRNAIAAEVERVIEALVSKSFDRTEYLKSLDRFYRAIEGAARLLPDFSEKQHFLNTVYERFFQGYSVKLADTMGIVYTPQPIVDFMCASVAEVLQKEFGKSLSSPDVYIIDPCTGTGNFIVNLLRRMSGRDLPRMYREQLFANEVMLLPYYIAALNIEHAYYELTGTYEPFEGLCFVDTLDLAEGSQHALGFMTEKNAERVERQRKAPITVVIGNPPYNMNQQNENDNNKNRKYEVIDRRVAETYARDSAASNKGALSDPYVKFFRWATDRLQGRDGIVAFVSNNSFMGQSAFDGMRKHLLADFTRLYMLDLHGDVRRNPKLSGTTHNVFGIQVGVGITVAVRKGAQRPAAMSYHRVEENWRKVDKLAFLQKSRAVGAMDWHGLFLSQTDGWMVIKDAWETNLFLPLGTKAARASKSASVEAIFRTFSRGIETCRDDWTYDFDVASLASKVRTLAENYNAELDRWRRAGKPQNIDDFVTYDPTKIKWCSRLKEALKRETCARFDESRVRAALYRPFTKRSVYVDPVLTHRRGLFPEVFPSAASEAENRVMTVTDIAYRAPTVSVLVSNCVADLHLCAGVDSHQCFPFYVYDEDGTNRRENITDWALEHFRKHYADKKITKWDIFYYAYGVLHHPEYRTKYAENLKRELPRIPLAKDFWGFSGAGKELARLHIEYEKLEPWPLEFIETSSGVLGPDVAASLPRHGGVKPPLPLSYRVEDKMRLSKDRRSLKVNDSLTLGGIPPETFEYRLGNRSALEWVIDQYQVTEDKRSGIRSDPNRTDDPEYIVRLVGQVVRVSLETVELVNSLPAL
ncbi:MAG TPA: type ISP restriction/modification enzyme [Terriglobia bacterium]|nr:type ISP restriction/modification enzyme [Terriglobia bacterium]